jgi:hypothetical protein
VGKITNDYRTEVINGRKRQSFLTGTEIYSEVNGN